jgi:hypothetical protein
MTTAEHPKKIHHGRNIKRFREMFGMKQEALAIELGPDWSQKKVSRLEENPEIPDDILTPVANALKLPVEAIKNFTEEAAVNIISNTFNSHDQSSNCHWLYPVNHNPVFSPIEQLTELVKKNEALYEKLLAAEKEKVALLEKLLDQKK